MFRNQTVSGVIVSWKRKRMTLETYQKQNQAQSDPLYRHYLFEIVFWILIFPFSLLFQRNSRSESEYFPLFQTFSRNCTLTSPTEGLLLQDLRWARTLVFLVQCSLNLTPLVTVVFPEYWSTHLHVIAYIPEFLHVMSGLMKYFFFVTELTTDSGSPLALFFSRK